MNDTIVKYETISELKSLVEELSDYANAIDNDYLKNKLINIKNLLR